MMPDDLTHISSSNTPPSEPFEYTHGAHPSTDGKARFSLWAPNAKQVAVVFLDGSIQPLDKQSEGWFSAQLFCPPGTSYQYLIDGTQQVPDPAARRQHDYNGFSCLVSHDYLWQHNEWRGKPWHQCIFYELHIGLIGGFTNAIKLLPYLHQLGITAIQLMPIAEFPGSRNWGYDGVYLFAPEMSYGTPDELKSFIDAAHGLGLMVFADVVYNHFGAIGNYINSYASDFFSPNQPTPWGDGINFELAQVRNFFIENAIMWVMDYHFDGLRLDAVHAIPDKSFLIELAARVQQLVGDARQVHLVLENENNHASLIDSHFRAQWNDDWHNLIHHLLSSENHSYYAGYQDDASQKLVRTFKEGFIYQGEPNLEGVPRGEPSGHLPPTAFINFLQNHDQVGNRPLGERLIHLTDHCVLKAATAALILSPMIPLLFMGEEWGENNPFLFFTDMPEEYAESIKEGRHYEIFSKGLPKANLHPNDIPHPNHIEAFKQSQIVFPDISNNFIENKSASEREWLEFYQRLIHLRKTALTHHLPNCRNHSVTSFSDRCIKATWQLADERYWHLYLNLSSEAVRIPNLSASEKALCYCGTSEAVFNTGLLAKYSAVVAISDL